MTANREKTKVLQAAMLSKYQLGQNNIEASADLLKNLGARGSFPSTPHSVDFISTRQDLRQPVEAFHVAELMVRFPAAHPRRDRGCLEAVNLACLA